MRLLSNKTLLLILFFISAYGYIASCTHKDMVLPTEATGVTTITHGTAILLPGAAGDTSKWKFDQVHSSVLWSGSYLGAAGLLTGRFNAFGINSLPAAAMQSYSTNGQPVPDTSWAFYENTPAQTFLNGYVQMNTSNTGEPARDGGCYLSYTGAPAAVSGTQNLNTPNIARIKSALVSFDPNSSAYIVNLTMTWQGLLSAPHDTAIVGKMTYSPRTVVGAGTASAYSVFGLQLNFQFDIRSFGMTTTEVSNIITVQCNMNFNNK